ncbi:type II secretion system F family protein [Cerasicoccus arenae]|uniref:Type II secretion system protein GspF n=1 Tax=Cerasicoccus arenae TaxID=424488 RepID=A0A8J3GEB6_9BACT|nr:type II secretion system F family protein [Cerasicoccus arenae]MBK1857962.1 type II secretion system F family protein [Cerasicoccus arenae]GHB97794.1 type II secretion system protein GspF [Cerasicoccus arenae]
MPTFSYKGIAEGGKTVTGVIEATDRKHALRKIRAGKVRPIDVKDAKGGGRTSAKAVESGSESTETFTASKGSKPGLFSRNKPSRKLALPFFRKLYQLHKSGMPIGDAMQIMSARMGDPALKVLAGEVYKDLSEGRTLANSMRGLPEYFEPTMSYLIEAGEATGNVQPILENIIDHLERKAVLQKEIQAAMAYPIMICCVALGVVALFLFYLLPRIQSMLDTMGGELNMAAKIMIGLADFALVQGPFVAVALFVVVLSLVQWRKTDKGRLATDTWALKLPIISGLYYNADICRLSNILYVLLSNGVNTTESLRLAENTLENKVLIGKYIAARTMVNDGAPFSASFKRYGLLPDLDQDILSIGENTGSLAPCFQEIYNTHAEELSGRLNFLTKLIAGLALGFAFTLVFILTLAIVMSILNMTQSIMAR